MPSDRLSEAVVDFPLCVRRLGFDIPMQKGVKLVYSTTRNLLSRHTRANLSSFKYFQSQSKSVSNLSARNVSQGKLCVESFNTSRLLSKRTFATGKDLRFATEARNLMLKGVDSLADAVEVRQSDCHPESLLIENML